MSYIRRKDRLVRKCVEDWECLFQTDIISSNFICPDFSSNMISCIEELLLIAPVVTIFEKIQPIIKLHGIEDTVGAAYWYMRKVFCGMKVSQLPKTIKCHPWVFAHQLYMSLGKHKMRLVLERTNVRNIAEWLELTHERSEVRRQLRRIHHEAQLLEIKL